MSHFLHDTLEQIARHIPELPEVTLIVGDREDAPDWRCSPGERSPIAAAMRGGLAKPDIAQYYPKGKALGHSPAVIWIRKQLLASADAIESTRDGAESVKYEFLTTLIHELAHHIDANNRGTEIDNTHDEIWAATYRGLIEKLREKGLIDDCLIGLVTRDCERYTRST